MYRIISFYTPDYTEVAGDLIKSLEDLKMTYTVLREPEFKDWREAVAHKPVFIKGMLAKYPGETLVWIDADAIVRQPLTLAEDFNHELAIHHATTYTSGTIFFKSPPAALIDRWIELSQDRVFHGDQEALFQAVKDVKTDVVDLPVSYCYIFDSNIDCTPVIEHFQASRSKRIGQAPKSRSHTSTLPDSFVATGIVGSKKRARWQRNYMRTTKRGEWVKKESQVPKVFKNPCYLVTGKNVEGLLPRFPSWPIVAVDGAIPIVDRLSLHPNVFAYSKTVTPSPKTIHFNGAINGYKVPEMAVRDLIKYLGSPTIFEITDSGIDVKTPDNIKDLKVFKSVGCYIIGKGPSLDMLQASDFPEPNWVVIAVNEAIHKVESLGLPNPIFGVHQDTAISKNCVPRSAGMLLGLRVYQMHKDRARAYDLSWLHITKKLMTGAFAISLANKLGCTEVIMLCFDGAMGGSCEYAKVIGHKATGRITRFKDFRASFTNAAKRTPLTYRYPRQFLGDIAPRNFVNTSYGSKYRVICFYTPTYWNVVCRMVESLNKHEIRYDVQEILTPFKSWSEAACYKPTHIQNMLKKYPGETLVWIDADAQVHQDLKIAETFEHGICCHKKGNLVRCGCMILKNPNPKIIAEWVALANSSKFDRADFSMYAALEKFPNADVTQLPVSYVTINGVDRNKDIVVEHFSAQQMARKGLAPNY